MTARKETYKGREEDGCFSKELPGGKVDAHEPNLVAADHHVALQDRVQTLTSQVETLQSEKRAILEGLENIKEQMVVLMKAPLEGAKWKREDEPEFPFETPFVRDIMMEPLPPKFELLVLDKYHGMTDPTEHVEGFKALMVLVGASDAIMCRAFATTLRKTALSWYTRLEPFSISSFHQLSEMFENWFRGFKRVKKPVDHLLHVRLQGEKESLKDYMKHFNLEALLLEKIDMPTAVYGLVGGLRENCEASSSLAKDLLGNFPKTYPELLILAEKHIEAEERDRSMHQRRS